MVCGLAEVRTSAGQSAPDGFQLPDASVAHKLAGPPEVGVGTLLAARLQYPLVVADGIAHCPPFYDGERERLLTVDVLACTARIDDLKRVPVIGSRDLDGVDILARKQLAVVNIGSAAAVCPVLNPFGVRLVCTSASRLAARHRTIPVSRALTIYVADRDHLNTGVVQETSHIRCALVSGPDETHVDAAAGRHMTVSAER